MTKTIIVSWSRYPRPVTSDHLDGPNTIFSLEGQGKEVEPPRAGGPDIEDTADMGAAAGSMVGMGEPGIEAGMLTPDEAGDVKVEAAVRLRSS